MGKKTESGSEEEKRYDPITKMAIKLLTTWAGESVKSSQNRKLVEAYIQNSSEAEILIAYTHIRKFNSFPSERFFHLVGERIDDKDLAYSRDFIESKLRSDHGRKIKAQDIIRR